MIPGEKTTAKGQPTAKKEDITDARNALILLINEEEEKKATSIVVYQAWMISVSAAIRTLQDLLPPKPEGKDDYSTERQLVGKAEEIVKQAEGNMQKAEAASAVTTTPPKSADDKTCTFSKELDGSCKIVGGDQAAIRSKIKELAHDKDHNYHVKSTNLADGGKRYDLYYDKEHTKKLSPQDRKAFIDQLYRKTKELPEHKEYTFVNKMEEQSSGQTTKNNPHKSTVPTLTPGGR
jgi:hypothetical protein